MRQNYHRLGIRFRNPETMRRLHALRQELRKKTNEKLPMSQLVENIVEQFLDTNSPLPELLEEKN